MADSTGLLPPMPSSVQPIRKTPKPKKQLSNKARGKQPAKDNDPDATPDNADSEDVSLTIGAAAKKKKTNDDLVAKCIVSNPPCVRLVAKEPWKSVVVVAGYLDFQTVTDFEDLIESQAMQDIIADLKRCTDCGYNILNFTSNKCQIVVKVFHETLKGLDVKEIALVQSSGSLPMGCDHLGINITDPRIMYLNYIAMVYRVLDVFDEHIEHSDIDHGSGTYAGFTPENWHRGLCAFKYAARQSGSSRTADTGKKSRRKADTQNVPTIPTFLNDDDFTAMKKSSNHDDTGGVDLVFESIRRLEEAIGLDDGPGALPRATSDLLNSEETDQLNRLFDGGLNTKSGSSVSRAARSQRPKLTEQQTMAWCSSMREKIVISWSKEQIDKMRAEDLENLTDEGKVRFRTLVENLTAGQRLDGDADGDEPRDEDEPSVDEADRVHMRNVALKAQMTSNSAPMPGYRESCDWLGCDYLTRIVTLVAGPNGEEVNIALKFWQPVAIYWMHLQDSTIHQWSVLALDCGLGKTLSFLLFVVRSNQDKIKFNALYPEDVEPYRATLVGMPASAIKVWLDDYRKFFNSYIMTVKVFYASPSRVGAADRHMVIEPTTEDLNKYLETLDPADPKTGTTIILTAYSTWWARTLGYTLGGDVAKYYGRADLETKAQEFPVGMVDTCMVPYEFERAAGDEAHTLRNPNTYMSRGFVQVRCIKKNWLTATPIFNHPREVRGYMCQKWNPYHALYNVDIGFHECYQPDFDPQAFQANVNNYAKLVSFVPPRPELGSGPSDLARYSAWQDVLAVGERTWVLDPENFKRCGDNTEWNARICSLMCDAIFSQTILRISSSTYIDLADGFGPRLVGLGIPPMNIYTVQLEMNQVERPFYEQKANPLFAQLYVGGSDQVEAATKKVDGLFDAPNSELETGLLDMGVYRHMTHIAADPRLGDLTVRNDKRMSKEDKQKANKTKRNEWVDLDSDFGASFYFIMTRASSEYITPSDRLSLSHYQLYYSVKFRFMVWQVGEWVLKLKCKVILIFEFPMVQWAGEAILKVLGFSVLAIRSSMTQDERGEVVAQFHEPQYQILTFNTKLGAQSLNLQAASKVLFVEIPPNLSTFVQGCGRVSRVGQLHSQEIVVPYIKENYDQIRLAKFYVKSHLAVCAEGGSDVDSLMISDVADETLRKYLGLQYSMRDPAWADPDWQASRKWVEEFKKNKFSADNLMEDNDDIGLMQEPQSSKKSRQKAKEKIKPSLNLIGIQRMDNIARHGINVPKRELAISRAKGKNTIAAANSSVSNEAEADNESVTSGSLESGLSSSLDDGDVNKSAASPTRSSNQVNSLDSANRGPPQTKGNKNPLSNRAAQPLTTKGSSKISKPGRNPTRKPVPEAAPQATTKTLSVPKASGSLPKPTKRPKATEIPSENEDPPTKRQKRATTLKGAEKSQLIATSEASSSTLTPVKKPAKPATIKKPVQPPTPKPAKPATIKKPAKPTTTKQPPQPPSKKKNQPAQGQLSTEKVIEGDSEDNEDN